MTAAIHIKRTREWTKPKVLDHLKRLSVEDRYTRFFSPSSDFALEQYVAKLSENDQLFVTLQAPKNVIFVTGFLHAAKISDDEYEIGVSVDADQRKNGIASALFDRAFNYVRAKGCKRIYINCLSTNYAMRRIVDKYKIPTSVDPYDPSTKIGIMELEGRPDFYSYVQGIHQDQIAMFDLAIGTFLSQVKI